ncbi:Tim44/TimA family putative adaptor protein [Devosia faecipullorum]|uniref:Tim44/TimA family putative adaptor protein n=1 Tax=Devosia faecipullorum TaxID=2755039 RepID=UPI00187BB97D|nr:Tim44/TimA family putative adaptor protein [Devosia faecipullorum]MBE7732623.1 Tim44 domain-containing protein [Devosia faecipullorum]
MDEFLDLPTLIAIVVAIFVLFRLRSVLGTRTGNERPPVDRSRSTPAEKNANADDTVVPLRPRPTIAQPDLDDERRARKLEAEIEQAAAGNAQLAEGLREVAEADPTFTPKSFLDGAKQAYEMVVTGFAEGDRQTLRNLLDKEVFDGFQRAIAEREAAGHKVDFTFVGLPRIAIVDAEYDKKNIAVTVDFHAEVVSATRDNDGNLVEGNADQVQIIADEWTFARNPKSRDPNWKVVTTSQLD